MQLPKRQTLNKVLCQDKAQNLAVICESHVSCSVLYRICCSVAGVSLLE